MREEQHKGMTMLAIDSKTEAINLVDTLLSQYCQVQIMPNDETGEFLVSVPTVQWNHVKQETFVEGGQ